MKTKIAKIWVEALRSGKYEQGMKQLKNENAYCCLGVLCDISKLGRFSNDEYYLIQSRSAQEIENDVLPVSVMKWAAIKDSSGLLNMYESLAEYNDSGKTFLEIADIIELNIEKL